MDIRPLVVASGKVLSFVLGAALIVPALWSLFSNMINGVSIILDIGVYCVTIFVDLLVISFGIFLIRLPYLLEERSKK